jgi:hypothetical protein
MARSVFRVTTYVPPEHLEPLLEAIAREANQLRFGPYEQWAWWSTPGMEQFRPLDGAAPTKGQLGQLERVASVRLEFALPRDPSLLERVLDAGLFPAHPWEVPVVFVEEALSPLPELD